MSATHPLQSITRNVAQARTQIVRVLGGRRPRTGLVWGEDQIVTRARGLDLGDEVRVYTEDGTQHAGKVVGRDGASDVALLGVENLGVTPLEVRTEPLELGEPLLTVFRGMGPTRAAFGIVGALGDAFRTRAGTRVDAWVELDRDLPRGATGAAVVDLNGKLVGVATRGVVRGATLVLPEASLRRLTDQLLQTSTIVRGYVGIAAHPARLPDELAEELGQHRAVVVAGIEADGPAAKAGVLVGDVIVAVDDQPIETPMQLRHAIGERGGKTLTTTVLRGGQKTEITIEPATRA